MIEIYRKSAVNVIDAKTMSPDPVAVVELPKRVPYGFHALFVTEVGIFPCSILLYKANAFCDDDDDDDDEHEHICFSLLNKLHKIGKQQ